MPSPPSSRRRKSVTLSWVPSSDNIQVDHYQILRNGVPLGATDATAFTDTDTAAARHLLSYVVRAVDTNGNTSDSDADDRHDARLDAAHARRCLTRRRARARP